jgi:hypothetical protein
MVCPVCTIAVALGVGVFRAWGIDDVVTGLWIGALIVSSIAWMIDYLNRKNIHFLFRKIIIILSFYAIFLIPLWKPFNIIGLSGNVLWGMDKIILGVIIGTILFILSVALDVWLKKANNNRVVIYYQRVFIPLIILLIASLYLHLIIKLIG